MGGFSFGFTASRRRRIPTRTASFPWHGYFVWGRGGREEWGVGGVGREGTVVIMGIIEYTRR